jgi:beta-hydroxylase
MKLSELPRKILNRLTVLLFAIVLPMERLLFRYSLVGHTELLDASRFPWTRELEENWRLIRPSSMRVLGSATARLHIDLSDEAAGLTERDNWKSFFFHAYGVPVPTTARVARTLHACCSASRA